MKRIWFLFVLLLVPLIFSGCYEEKVKDAVQKLKVGMSKNELDVIVKDLDFIKEQSVEMYPNFSIDDMRASLSNNENYERKYPENLIDILTFDGNIKVYSFLIRKEKTYANPPTLSYLAVFHNKKDNSVIGWAQIRTSGDVDTLQDKF